MLDLGLHTMVEKPLGLTIRGCNHVIAAAERNGKILSVAENYRRDPINRLARALLDDGAIGDRQFIMETAVRGRDNLIITPWRHQKLTGAITLDAGVHNADILLYYFGDATGATDKPASSIPPGSGATRPGRVASTRSGPRTCRRRSRRPARTPSSA